MAKQHLDHLQNFFLCEKMACAFEPKKPLFAMQDLHLWIF